jgi:ribose transport system ATP-binding protein
MSSQDGLSCYENGDEGRNIRVEERRQTNIMNAENILVLKDINKGFFGAMVLHNISLDVRKGEILGLVGENGAGKSTLMNILGGVLPPDTGSMELKGQPYSPSNPRDADKARIAFIHQELSLFSNLTVAENMFIDDLPTTALWSVQFEKMRTEAREYIEKFGVNTTPDAKVETLSMGIRQTIEITKALIKNAEIIIFDEPTTSLSQTEKDNLFKIIPQLKAQGVTIIYISHIIEDVFHLCDRIAVLRDGLLVGVQGKDQVSYNQVVKMMVGRELNQVYPTIEKNIGEVVYRAKHIQRGKAVKDVSFDLRVGEIVGLFGLMGAGRTELVRCLFGADPIDAGEIEFKGKHYRRISPEISINKGIAFITEDRRQEGLLMPKTVKENIVLAKLNDLRERFGVISSKKEDQEADMVIKELNVKVQDKNKQAAKNLSGGNQQKVVISKWILKEPSMFIMDEPTRGVDVGSKYEIYTIINTMAKNGATVLFISSEMEELMGICDRIMVMSKGKLVAEVPKSDYSQEKIISYALGGVS